MARYISLHDIFAKTLKKINLVTRKQEDKGRLFNIL